MMAAVVFQASCASLLQNLILTGLDWRALAWLVLVIIFHPRIFAAENFLLCHLATDKMKPAN